MGKPKNPENLKCVVFLLPEKHKEALEKYAEKKDRKLSYILRFILKEYLTSKKLIKD